MEQSELIDILLVEDNVADAELVLRALKRINMTNKLVWLKDGQEAMDFLSEKNEGSQKDQKPRMILLDLRLPKIDGLDVLRRIRTDNKTKFIPVVILTSSKDEVDMVTSYALGVNSFIHKPIEAEEFSGLIEKMCAYWLLINRAPY